MARPSAPLSEAAAPAVPPLTAQVPVRRLEGQALVAWQRLSRLHGPGERRAALLGLMLTPGSARERQAWGEETLAVDNADQVLGLIALLPAQAWLPAYERLLARSVETPADERRDLLAAARRVMAADGRISAIDRLQWLLMRHRLSGRMPLLHGGVRDSYQLDTLPLAMRQALACWSADLARMVPCADPVARVGAAGAQWHARVVQLLWGRAPDPPACHPPDVDQLGRALQTIDALPWMRRPLVARTWVEAAWAAGAPPVDLRGARALRLACGLLDTPLPPVLARQFIEPPLLAAPS